MEKTIESQLELIKNHPLSQTVITKEQATTLVGEDEASSGPTGSTISDEEFWKYVDETTGMTFEQYAKFRWPDSPLEQYNLILSDLNLPGKID